MLGELETWGERRLTSGEEHDDSDDTGGEERDRCRRETKARENSRRIYVS